MSHKKAVNLFQTKVFKVALVSFLSGLAPILIRAYYERRGFLLEDALTITALSSTMATTLIGRSDTSPVYTPDYLPGSNASEFTSRRN